LSFDASAVLEIPPDNEGSLGELTPPSGDRDVSVPHRFNPNSPCGPVDSGRDVSFLAFASALLKEQDFPD